MALFYNVNKNLARELLRASILCGQSSEEEGGLILEKNDDYEFVKVRNIYTGSQTALGLYETDLDELNHLVMPRLGDGAKVYASFHTHPSFSPNPSNIDVAKLFQGFKHNYIFASERRIFSGNTWIDGQDEFYTYYFSLSTLNKIAEYEAQ